MNEYDDPGYEDVYDPLPLPYNLGINNDAYRVWRDSYEIGYVHLAFRIIVEAMYDLLCGNPEDMLSASVFFYGKMVDNQDEEGQPYGAESDPVDWSTGSLYPVYAQIVGFDRYKLPQLVERHRKGITSTKDVEKIRSMYTTMATI